MKPYYEDESVTLYHGNCLEIDAWLKADLLVTDPPYGIGWEQPSYKTVGRSEGTRTKAHGSIQNDGDVAARDEALTQWLPKPGLVFGAIEREQPRSTRRVLVWKKPNDAGLFGQSIWRKDWEPIFVVGNWPQLPATESSVLTTGGSHRQYAQGVHPHAKPVPLLERLISKSPQGVIADPFAGSGSTLLAARNLGRKAIGVEIEERYCEIIARRLDQMCLDFGEAG
jgi:DNA modification methylase